MTPENPVHVEAGFHQARSCALSLVSWGFHDPSAELVQALQEPARWDRWPAMLAERYPETAEHLDLLTARINALEPDALSFLAGEHGRLFGHTVRGNCPLYELEYARGEILQQAARMADLAGSYAAFGLELSAEGHERHDHISAECEFLAVLAAREGHAVACGDAEAVELLHDAQRQFLSEHGGQWIPGLAQRLLEADPDGFYGALGAFTGALIHAECDRLEVQSGPALISVAPVELPEDSAMTCGIDSGFGEAGTGGLVQLNISEGLIRG